MNTVLIWLSFIELLLGTRKHTRYFHTVLIKFFSEGSSLYSHSCVHLSSFYYCLFSCQTSLLDYKSLRWTRTMFALLIIISLSLSKSDEYRLGTQKIDFAWIYICYDALFIHYTRVYFKIFAHDMEECGFKTVDETKFSP